MPRKKRAKPRDLDAEAQEVAWYLCQDNPLTLKQIAKLINVSETEASRLKRRAEEERWIRLVCGVPEEKQAEIEKRAIGYKEIEEKLRTMAPPEARGVFQEIRVFDSGEAAPRGKEYDQRLRRFSQAASRRVADLLPRMRMVGVTWGKTIASLVEGLRTSCSDPPGQGHDRRFIPLCGVLVDDPNIGLSSSSLAAELHEFLGGGPEGPLSLGAVIARIPQRFRFNERPVERKAREVIQQLVEDVAGYRDVFLGEPGGVGPLIDQIDSILTSVGSNYQGSSDPWLEEWISRENLTRQDLDRLVVGDIGGVFLPRSDATKKQRELVEDLNVRWNGIKFDHFRRCAATAPDARAAGVVVLAVGSRKAHIIRECVRHGLVNELIVDYELARALAEG